MVSTPKRYFKNVKIEDLLSISSVEQIGPLAWQRLYMSFSNLDDLLRADESHLQTAGLTAKQAEAFIRREKTMSSVLTQVDRHMIEFATIEDEDYPELLKNIADPPLWLFYRGDLSCLNELTLTVVGSRKPTTYANEVVTRLFPPGMLKKITTVSGLAYGIDAAIHRASLQAAGKTAAVLAGGLDVIYPADHTNLAKEIVESGGVLISEYPPLSRPQPYKFPVRNRIGAGLSRATIVIEAKIKSGTLTTAKAALDYDRDIFAVPGDINKETSEGANTLIKRGAMLLDDPEQLFDYFGLQSENEENLSTVDSRQANLLNLLTDRPLDMDQIVAESGEPIESVLGLITALELSGLIYQVTSGQYLASIGRNQRKK